MSLKTIFDINETNLHQIIEQSMTTPVLFYFWSPRSQHCEQLTPMLEKLANQYRGQFILAKVDCDAEQRVAAQFGLRAIPTVYLFQQGQPVDGFQGPQPEEAVRALLDKVLPREEELKAQEAMALIEEGKHAEALPLLKEAWQLSNQNSEIGLLLAQTQIALQRSEDAEAVLKTIPMQDQDTRYQALVAQIDLRHQCLVTGILILHWDSFQHRFGIFTALQRDLRLRQQQADFAVLVRQLPRLFQQRQRLRVFTFLNQRHRFLSF